MAKIVVNGFCVFGFVFGPGRIFEAVLTLLVSQVTPPVEEVPAWVKREEEKKLAKDDADLPFGLLLLFSCFTTIAAVRFMFNS